MAPRRGGEAGAGAAFLYPGKRNALQPPPLRRMQPWLQDGAGQCDLIAGGVDESGAFKGVYLTGMHLLALLRSFQLSKVFMPVETSTPVARLGQSLHDGLPIIVVTRGCFGRNMDYGPGPIRNEMQKKVWDTVRQMRADMPQVLITCIDLPIDCSAEIVQGCMEAPLNEYRELMYHGGTWYTPAIYNSKGLEKWKADHKREKYSAVGSDQLFNRKKFSWMDESNHYNDIWTLDWKPVLELKPQPQVALRTDLNFVDRDPLEVKPMDLDTRSNAHATLQKEVAAARDSKSASDMLQAVKQFWDRISYVDRAGLIDAISACKEAASLFDEQSMPKESFDCMTTAVEAARYMNNMDEALTMASELMASQLKVPGSDGTLAARAATQILDIHISLGDMEAAVRFAQKSKDELIKLPKVHAQAWGLVVTVELHRGDNDAALKAAAEAVKAPNKIGQAQGHLLVAEVQNAKANMSYESNAKIECWTAAVKAQKEAMALFKAASEKREEGRCMESIVCTLMSLSKPEEALDMAAQLQAFGEEADRYPDQDLARLSAIGSRLIAEVHVKDSTSVADFRLPGGQESMMAAAKRAVQVFEKLGDMARRSRAAEVLLQARRCKNASS